MEGNIVLGHEFVMDDLFAILPPAFPFFRVASRDAQIPNGGIKPHVEDLHTNSKQVIITVLDKSQVQFCHLVSVSFKRDRSAPFQVTRYATWLQAFLNPGICNDAGVMSPSSCHTIHPSRQLILNLRWLKYNDAHK